MDLDDIRRAIEAAVAAERTRIAGLLQAAEMPDEIHAITAALAAGGDGVPDGCLCPPQLLAAGSTWSRCPAHGNRG